MGVAGGFEMHYDPSAIPIGQVPMKKIQPPRLRPDDPDRIVDCELYLEPAVDELAVGAMACGWSEEEIETALIGVAKGRMLARIERAAVGRQIERFQKIRQ